MHPVRVSLEWGTHARRNRQCKKTIANREAVQRIASIADAYVRVSGVTRIDPLGYTPEIRHGETPKSVLLGSVLGT
jgi:hypothetical protein